MENLNSPKVAIDTNIANSVPTIVVSRPAISKTTEETPKEKPNTPLSFIQKFINFILDFLETIVVALSIFVVVYLFLVKPHEVKGSSMEPNFQNNDYILTDKISYKINEPSRGDVVIFKSPKNPEVDYIKRVIGLPGERVKVQNGSVFINDKKLEEPYLKDRTLLFPGSYLQEGVEITVPVNEYFVFGDNRPHSSDSREFGPIPISSIIGKALIRYWPLTKLGPISKSSY